MIRIVYWCLAAVALLIVLAWLGGGVYLNSFYRPTEEWAYTDVLALRESTHFGVVSELHRRLGYAAPALAGGFLLFGVVLATSANRRTSRHWAGIALAGLCFAMTLVLVLDREGVFGDEFAVRFQSPLLTLLAALPLFPAAWLLRPTPIASASSAASTKD